jgi:hypothetical protein
LPTFAELAISSAWTRGKLKKQSFERSLVESQALLV